MFKEVFIFYDADWQIHKTNIYENTIFPQSKKIGIMKINEFTIRTDGES